MSESQECGGRLIAIGDIHGCLSALNAVLAAIAPRSDDTLVLLGDYVDRGPDSRGVLNRVLALCDTCHVVPLLGNHEQMLLLAYEDHSQAFFWLQCGGQATLDSYGGMPDDVPGEHLEFLQACLPYFETEQFLFVHANYDPALPLPAQPRDLLLWVHLHSYMPAPHVSGKTAIVGHTPQKSGEVLDLGHVICLDTHCVGSGWLTAMDVVTRQVWQADKYGRLRPP